MFIDKEGKLFGKISIIDVIVILAIVIAGFGMYLRVAGPGAKNVKDAVAKNKEIQKIEYTVKIKGIREGNVEALKKRGELFELSTGERIGKISKVEASEAVDYRDVASGEIVKMNTPDKYDVLITVKHDINAGDEGYYTDWGTVLSVGSRYDFFTKYSRVSGEIVSLKEID